MRHCLRRISGTKHTHTHTTEVFTTSPWWLPAVLRYGECLYLSPAGFVDTAGKSIFIFILSLPSSSNCLTPCFSTFLPSSSRNVHDHSTKKVYSVGPVGGRGHFSPDVSEAPSDTLNPLNVVFSKKTRLWSFMEKGGELDKLYNLIKWSQKLKATKQTGQCVNVPTQSWLRRTLL